MASKLFELDRPLEDKSPPPPPAAAAADPLLDAESPALFAALDPFLPRGKSNEEAPDPLPRSFEVVDGVTTLAVVGVLASSATGVTAGSLDVVAAVVGLATA